MLGLELTYMARQWKSPEDPPPLYGASMASSEVDRKFLGHFAKNTIHEHGYLSSFLFRILGLSVVLSEDLLRARRAKRLDPIRDPAHRKLVHHILWLAREGLVMMEQYVLPMLSKSPNELRVLALKLKASLYHIFVLFHNDPAVNDRINRRRSGSGSLFPLPLSPKSKSSSESPTARQRSPAISLGTAKTPPGLPLPGAGGQFYLNGSHSNGTATFLLPLQDYRAQATAAFREAQSLAADLLPGSHPVRLSVEVEYVAYIYDCLHEAEQSRRRAKAAIRAVYEAQEGMDDESFVDASELVSILGRMMHRGLGSGSSSSQPGAPAMMGGAQQAQTAMELAQQAQQQRNGGRSGHRRGRSSQSSATASGDRGRGGGGGGGSGGRAQQQQQQPTTWV